MAMDAFSALKEIYAAFQYLHEVHEMAKKLGETSADMVARILAFKNHLASIRDDWDFGRFKEPGQLQALLRLQDAVLAAEG
jgi:hypothetical protein